MIQNWGNWGRSTRMFLMENLTILDLFFLFLYDLQGNYLRCTAPISFIFQYVVVHRKLFNTRLFIRTNLQFFLNFTINQMGNQKLKTAYEYLKTCNSIHKKILTG